MSEANNVWRVEVDGREHEIEVEHSTLSGKIKVKHDGKLVGEDRMLARQKEISVDVGGHPTRVTVSMTHGGFGARSALHLDERYVEPLR